MKRPLLILLASLLGLFTAARGGAGDITPQDIMKSLLSGNPDRVSDVITLIGKNRPAELPPLIIDAFLASEDPAVRKTAMSAMKQYPPAKTVPLWLEALKKTGSFPIKKEIIDHFMTMNDRRIVVPLVEELRSPFNAVRESAILALKRMGDDRMFPYILDMAHDPNPIFRIYALEAIYHLYDRRLYDLLIGLLKDENKSVRYYTLKCIEKNQLSTALPHVRTMALSDANSDVRVKAVDLLGSLHDTGSLYVALKCLSDPNRDIRFATVNTLHALAQRPSGAPLSQQLTVEDDDAIKEIILAVLVKIRTAGGYRGLEKVLSSEKKVSLRIKAAYALGEIREDRSVPLLLGTLSDADPRVRAEACNSLGSYREKRILVKLLEVINDDTSLYVRTASLYSLNRMRDREALVPLFDRFAIETDPVFRDKLRQVIRGFIR
jgi:HEAT repeat protein